MELKMPCRHQSPNVHSWLNREQILEALFYYKPTWVLQNHSRASNAFVKPQNFDSLGQAWLNYLSQTLLPKVTKTKSVNFVWDPSHGLTPNKIKGRYGRKCVL